MRRSRFLARRNFHPRPRFQVGPGSLRPSLARLLQMMTGHTQDVAGFIVHRATTFGRANAQSFYKAFVETSNYDSSNRYRLHKATASYLP